MKILRLFTLSFIFSVILILPGIAASAFAQQDSASVRNLLEERDKEIKELMGPKGTEYTQQQREQLKDIINGVMDYAAMAEYALDDTYDTLSTGQREEFVDLFASVIRDQSLSKLDIYRADVTYRSIKVNGDSARVNTLAVMDNVRTPVIYEMQFEDEPDQWMVTDMVIDDVSTAGSYRRQFQRIIQKKGYEGLVQTLRKRASS